MFYIIWKIDSYNKSIQQFKKTMNYVKNIVNLKDCWTVLTSSKADRTNCKFDIQHQKIKNKKTVNIARLTEKKTTNLTRKY